MLAMFCRALSDESGATAVEYAFIASLIALAIAGVVGIVGGSLASTFTSAASNI